MSIIIFFITSSHQVIYRVTEVAMGRTKLYSLKDLARISDCQESICVAIHNSVYDITDFVKNSEHPGGNEILLGASGSDATKIYEHHGHSAQARLMLHWYKKGELTQADRTVTSINLGRKKKWIRKENTDRRSSIIWAIAVIIGIIFTILYQLT